MTEELKVVVARNLRLARWNHNWSQEFVSRQTGLSIRTISRAETGKGISKETLKRLCTFYAIRLESVYSTDRISQVSIEPIPFNTAARLLSQSSFVNDIQREAILQFNYSIQRNAAMCRAQVEDILPEVISKKQSYSRADIIQCCIEINRRTIVNISELAIQ